MLIVVGLSILVGVLDGFGIAMFFPLLQMVAGDSDATGDNMGNLQFLIILLESTGITLNLQTVLIAMLVFFIMKGCVKFYAEYKNVLYRQYFIRTLRVDSIKALSNYDYYNFVSADAGKIQNTVSGEVNKVSSAFKDYMHVLQQFVMLTVYVILAFLANPQFAFLVAIGGIVTNLLFNILYKKTKSLSRKLTKSNHDFQGLIIQQVAQFKYLKSTGYIEKYGSKLVGKVDEIERSERKIGIIGGFIKSVKEPLLISVVVIVILIEVLILGGSLSLIILSILFFYRALTAVMNLQTHWNKFLGKVGSLENFESFVVELKKGKERQGKNKLEKLNEKIVFDSVQFEYADTNILSDINLVINKNESVALVGESGSGKTTLLNLITGLLRPTNGSVFIDGINTQNLNRITFQSRIGYITQDAVIFNDTIYNNVTLWAPISKANFEKFELALRKANIWSFVMVELQNKEQTQLGNNGINLSGGQKQRLSIAREIFKDIDILILDEATSALDSETEKKIQNNIDSLKGSYTIITVAHRLSTIVNADKIVVMSKGKIVDVGSYDDLLTYSSVFKRMVDNQKLVQVE